MATWELSVVTEGFKEATYLLDSNVTNMVLNLACPEVNSIKSALIALVVRPKSSEGDAAAHMFRGSRAVLLFEELKYRRVVDTRDDHIIHDVGHLFER